MQKYNAHKIFTFIKKPYNRNNCLGFLLLCNLTITKDPAYMQNNYVIGSLPLLI